MARYLDPKNDLTFKRIFGEHEHLCKSLLNNMLPLEPSQQIVTLQYQQSEMVPEIPALKDSIVDVHCIDNTGRQFIVEMQMYWTDSFRSRVLFNASKAYIKQLDSAKEYKFLQPVYALSFVNEIFDRDTSDYYHDYKIVNIANRNKQLEGLEFVFIELPKFRPGNRAEKKLYDLWLTFLTQIKEGTEVIPPELLEEEVTKEAVQYLESNSYTRGQLDAYDRYWDSIRTERMYYLDASDKGLREGLEKGLKRGLERGLEKGLKKGLEKGLEKGRAEGRAEGKAEGLRNVVISGKRNGLSLEQIQAITSLSKEKIAEILTSTDV
ncbi:MAG: Rpn family recombination-promoting nuclease/putative transposase [Prevotellaceae bacterium]|jgi:predicted transposase/invertase (TIGR01784 family)|nr:Rpn family recombination-promoting nuclease/putative transposase [Prevotellaceae bacterium]